MNQSKLSYNPSPPSPSVTVTAPILNVRPRAPRPPRIQIHGNGSYKGSMPPTATIPLTAQTNPTLNGSQGQPDWAEYYANYMSKGFEEIVESGLSFGETFTFKLYEKFSKWSKKWFTHIFLCLVMLLYSVGGAVMFQTIEERHVERKFIDTHTIQKQLFKAIQILSQDLELRKLHPDEFNGRLVFTLRNHKDAVKSFINSEETVEEMETFENPWRFWNAMFYCGTIYTTIEPTRYYQIKTKVSHPITS